MTARCPASRDWTAAASGAGMKDSLRTGLGETVQVEIDRDRTIGFMDEVLRFEDPGDRREDLNVFVALRLRADDEEEHVRLLAVE